jgi:hypothetical protein
MEPARRWLSRSITKGTPLWASMELEMSEAIKLGKRWQPFRARQVLAPDKGFVWVAKTRIFGLPIKGFEQFFAGQGQMRWKLLQVVPFISASGPEVTRSAAGRLAAEAALLPTSFGTATWSAGTAPDIATMTRTIDGEDESVHLKITAEGRLS